MRVVNYLILCCLTLIGIILIGSLPGLFVSAHIDLKNYWKTIMFVIHSLINFKKMTYTLNNVSRPIFPLIFENWRYSLILMFSSFCISLVLAAILSFATMLLPQFMRRFLKGILFFLESIPDLLIIITVQLIGIYFYIYHQVRLYHIYSYQHNIFFLPILSLTILPTILIYRMLVLDVEEEGTKIYVELAKSKGLSKTVILSRHVMRNTLIRTLTHAKTILFFMLSNLLIVEVVFQSQGLLKFVYTYGRADILTLVVIMIFLPMAIFFGLCKLLVRTITGESYT